MLRAIKILLAAIVLTLVWILARDIISSVSFDKTMAHRRAAVIEGLERVRRAERTFKSTYGRYTSSFDSLSALSAADSTGLRFIPFSDRNGGKLLEYRLEAGFIAVNNGQTPVFECYAPYASFLGDLNRGELDDLIGTHEASDRYPGITVGSMERPGYEGGSWEEL